jgi:hypothetical protein
MRHDWERHERTSGLGHAHPDHNRAEHGRHDTRPRPPRATR